MNNACFESIERRHGFLCGNQIIGHKSKINHCCFIAVSIRHDGCCCSITDNCNLKALFKQFSHVRFGTQVCRHSCQHNSANSTLAKLKYKIVGLWPINFVWTSNHGFSILDVRLVVAPASQRLSFQILPETRHLCDQTCQCCASALQVHLQTSSHDHVDSNSEVTQRLISV